VYLTLTGFIASSNLERSYVHVHCWLPSSPVGHATLMAGWQLYAPFASSMKAGASTMLVAVERPPCGSAHLRIPCAEFLAWRMCLLAWPMGRFGVDFTPCACACGRLCLLQYPRGPVAQHISRSGYLIPGDKHCPMLQIALQRQGKSKHDRCSMRIASGPHLEVAFLKAYSNSSSDKHEPA
jgi:hypothetical protein